MSDGNDHHKRLVRLADEAITDVFSDQSVSRSVTRESLEGLKEIIETMLGGLEDSK